VGRQAQGAKSDATGSAGARGDNGADSPARISPGHRASGSSSRVNWRATICRASTTADSTTPAASGLDGSNATTRTYSSPGTRGPTARSASRETTDRLTYASSSTAASGSI
jgi:hypothetical protein